MTEEAEPSVRVPRTTRCRVCRAGMAEFWQAVRGRDYWRCAACQAVFLDASQLPDAATERARYLQHHNDPGDPAYRTFLARLAEPLLARLGPGCDGLDFGCGPGPALAGILAAAGHTLHLYDPFFHADASALAHRYDFITCSEVVEHFHQPAREFVRLDALLKPGGWLGILTCFLTDARRFADWHYRRDVTHVVFYRPETFLCLAAELGWTCEIPARNVVLMRKGGAGASPADGT